MLNKSPVHGAEHTLLPELSMVETSTTPSPFAGLEQDPCTATPLMHSVVKVGEVMRLPERLALEGFRTLLMVLTKMSKPPIGSEPWRKTVTVSWEPCAPLNDGMPLGHDVLPVAAMQTSPTDCPRTESVEAGTAMRDATTMSTNAINFFIFTLAPVFFLRNQSGAVNIRVFRSTSI